MTARPMDPSNPDLPEALVAAEVRAICRRYRMDEEAARELLLDEFARHPELLREIAARYPEEDVTRLGAYRRAVKNVKKQVYYALRQYNRDADDRDRLERQLEQAAEASDPAEARRAAGPTLDALLRTHVSTRERAPHYQAFYERLFGLVDPPRRILDVGCGLHPLSYPFDAAARRPELYVALDRAEDAVETLRRFAPLAAPTTLRPIRADLAEAPWRELSEGEPFDLAFLLKVVPVVYRMQREAVGHLAEIPARRLLVTASSEALTRRESIRRREERVLQAFVAQHGLHVADRFELPNEFGYLLARD